MVLQLTVFWPSGAVLGRNCLGLLSFLFDMSVGPWACWLGDHVAQLGFIFPPMGPWSLCCSVVGWL